MSVWRKPATNSRTDSKTPTRQKPKPKSSVSRDGSPKKISQMRFDENKSGNPFAPTKRSKHKTEFAYLYSLGSIPCRLDHGSVKHKLRWEAPFAQLDYSLLVLCAEGIVETTHPYVFVSRTAFKEMLEDPEAPPKAVYLLPRLVPALRKALMSSVRSVMIAGLEATEQLSNCVGPELNPHLSVLLIQIHKKAFKREWQDRIMSCINTLASNGGQEALAIIKSKIPTFQFA